MEYPSIMLEPLDERTRHFDDEHSFAEYIAKKFADKVAQYNKFDEARAARASKDQPQPAEPIEPETEEEDEEKQPRYVKKYSEN